MRFLDPCGHVTCINSQCVCVCVCVCVCKFSKVLYSIPAAMPSRIAGTCYKRTYSLVRAHLTQHQFTFKHLLYYTARGSPAPVTREHILSQEHTFCHKRAHSVTREHILSQENTFCHKRTHSVTREHILSQESTFSHKRTHSVTRAHILSQENITME